MTNTNKIIGSGVVKDVAFPVGYDNLHSDTSINFQMNRFYNWVSDPTMLDEMRSAAPHIKTYDDLKREILALAEGSLKDNQVLKAAYYFRLAEFFIFTDDPDKQAVRKRFLELICQAYPVAQSGHFLIPYETAQLSAYRFTPDRVKGAIVLFGGFDSYIEEWFPMFYFLKDAGYDVIAFEGPGQGSVLEDFHVPMTHEWEKPVKAILDYFALDDVTLIGLSLGGCLSIRAAAHESRVRRVVSDDILTDFYEVNLRQTNPVVRTVLKLLLRSGAAGAVNWLVFGAMQRSRVVEWGIKQGMHVMDVQTPYEYFKRVRLLQTRDVSHLIKQDVLLMAGADDHYVPLRQFYEQIRLLTHVRSLTARLFTSDESAQNHCQIGNMGLSLNVIVDWVEQCSQRSISRQLPRID